MPTRRAERAGGARVKARGTPAARPHKAVERVRDISLRSFVEDFFTPRRPVVLAGAAAGWAASSSWTLERLASIVGDISLPVFKSRSPVFRPEVGYAFDQMRAAVRFGDYVRMVRDGGSGDGYYYYLASLPFSRHYPVLEKEVDFSYFLTKKQGLNPHIWISAGGTVTPLHFDPFEKHNFHAVIRGRKRFLLYEPEDGRFLAPHPPDERISQFSRVDVDDPDLRSFPDFPKAQGFECALGEGDMIFMPMWWWHQVKTERPAISVNLWWHERSLRRPRGGARPGRGEGRAGARPPRP